MFSSLLGVTAPRPLQPTEQGTVCPVMPFTSQHVGSANSALGLEWDGVNKLYMKFFAALDTIFSYL